MIQQRHPAIAEVIIRALEDGPNSPCLEAVQNAALELDGVEGFEVSEWTALAGGLRPEPREPELHEPGGQRVGWQHEAASRVERQFRATHILPHLTPTRRAMLRSQSGPVAGIPFSVAPSSFLTRLDPTLFRVLLQRRLSLPLPLSKRSCRCGRLLDAFSHHRAACSRSGVLGRRGFSLESAVARVCREAGGRVATNLLVRDMDLGVPNAHDNRRLEVVADGLPLFGGVQRWPTTTRGIQQRRCGSHTCSEEEGDHLPRTCATGQSRKVGGFGLGGWRQVVEGSRDLRAVVSPGMGEVGAIFDPTANGAGVALALVLGHFLCRSSGFCRIPVGTPWRSRG